MTPEEIQAADKACGQIHDAVVLLGRAYRNLDRAGLGITAEQVDGLISHLVRIHHATVAGLDTV